MRELITLSLGPLSNFTASHFWNFQDEWLKQETEKKDRNPVLFYETHKTGQWVPRTLFVDFQEHFGNYLSTFSFPAPKKPDEKDSQAYWHQGKVQVAEREIFQKSDFQRELDMYEVEEEAGEEDEEEETKERHRD